MKIDTILYVIIGVASVVAVCDVPHQVKTGAAIINVAAAMWKAKRSPGKGE